MSFLGSTTYEFVSITYKNESGKLLDIEMDSVIVLGTLLPKQGDNLTTTDDSFGITEGDLTFLTQEKLDTSYILKLDSEKYRIIGIKHWSMIMPHYEYNLQKVL